MKKLFIITLATITLGSYTPSFARITSIESYRGITVDYAKASEGCASAYSQTCASPLEGEGMPCGGKYRSCQCKSAWNTTCSSPYIGDGTGCTLGGTTKYKSCKCPATYTKTCSSPYEGTTAACNGKYTACKCKSEYTKTCTGEGEEGFGSDCGGKYASCQCKSSYKTCASGYRGVGSACTADGGEKYTSCVENCSSDYKYTCDAAGQTGSGDSCGGKYKSCTATIAEKTCELGDVVYSNGKCYIGQPEDYAPIAIHTNPKEKTCVEGDALYTDGKCYEYGEYEFPINAYNYPIAVVFDQNRQLALFYQGLLNQPWMTYPADALFSNMCGYMLTFDDDTIKSYINGGFAHSCHIPGLLMYDRERYHTKTTSSWGIDDNYSITLEELEQDWYGTTSLPDSGFADTLAMLAVNAYFNSYISGDDLANRIINMINDNYSETPAIVYSALAKGSHTLGDLQQLLSASPGALYCMALNYDFASHIASAYSKFTGKDIHDLLDTMPKFFLPRLGDLRFMLAGITKDSAQRFDTELREYISSKLRASGIAVPYIRELGNIAAGHFDIAVTEENYSSLIDLIQSNEYTLQSTAQTFQPESAVAYEMYNFIPGEGGLVADISKRGNYENQLSLCITHYGDDWAFKNAADLAIDKFSGEYAPYRPYR